MSELKPARQEVDAGKRALGERGAVWWTDGAPDYSRRLAKNTPYAEWFSRQPENPCNDSASLEGLASSNADCSELCDRS